MDTVMLMMLSSHHSRATVTLFILLMSHLNLQGSSFSSRSRPLNVSIRRFRSKDTVAIANLFHDTVRSINIRDYSSSQAEAWAPDDIYFRDWDVICQNRFTVVAEVDRNAVVGFAELEDDGHIDLFYCHKSLQRQGIGRMLYQAIEVEAKARSLAFLHVEASISAIQFFESMGFSHVKEQSVPRRGESFTNYSMRKNLAMSGDETHD